MLGMLFDALVYTSCELDCGAIFTRQCMLD